MKKRGARTVRLTARVVAPYSAQVRRWCALLENAEHVPGPAEGTDVGVTIDMPARTVRVLEQMHGRRGSPSFEVALGAWVYQAIGRAAARVQLASN